MSQHARLSIIGIALLVVSACNSATGPEQTANIEATVSAQVSATLTAERVKSAPLADETENPTPIPPSDDDNAQSPSMPVIAYFNCDPCVVEPGGASTLSWDLSGATAAYLDDHGITAPGSTVVHPDQTTTYRLVAVNDSGRSGKAVTVEVRGLPTIHYFTCLPCEIAKGEQATLSWDLSGATAAYLDGNGVTAPDSITVAPDQTTTYRLEAVSERGSVQRLVTVTVTEGENPQAVSETLDNLGYDVRSVGHLPLASGEETISVIMAAATNDPQSNEITDQYLAGFEALYDSFPGQTLTVGLYDGVRAITFVTAKAADFESLLRGQSDLSLFWKAVTLNVWDEWTQRWLEVEPTDFYQQNYASKSFGF